MVRGWFEDALGGEAEKPSVVNCKILARAIQVAINRVNNKEKQTSGVVDVLELKDDGGEWFSQKIGRLQDVAYKVILEAREFEEFAGNYHWEDDQGSLSLYKVIGIMHRIGAHPRVPEMSSFGRPVSHGTPRREKSQGSLRQLCRRPGTFAI
jgi:hypothetical protein